MPLVITLYILQEITIRNSLAVQWLGLGASTAGTQVPFLMGNKDPQAQQDRKKKKRHCARHSRYKGKRKQSCSPQRTPSLVGKEMWVQSLVEKIP